MSERFDVIVIGAGPGGEVVADRLIEAGRNVCLVERELIGGECAYWACIPSKALVRPVDLRGEAAHGFGVSVPDLDWEGAAAYRDFMARNWDDSKQVAGYEERGATVVKGDGVLAGARCVRVGDRVLEAPEIVLATGSVPRQPPIDGIDGVTVWTNREATAMREVPGSAVVVGAGPVGVEMAQVMARFGAQVTLVHPAALPLNREDGRVGELLAQALRDDGIDLRLGVQAERARRDGDAAVLSLSDGAEVRGDVVLTATGREPRTHGIGLESIGLAPGKLAIDGSCRVAEGLWAVGDVTGAALFTHVAKYQARIVADTLMGNQRTADLRSVPRVVFCDPEVAAVGLTAESAAREGIDVATATVELPELISKPWLYERDPRGELGVLADRARGVLVGAWAVAPLAGEWIHTAALAIQLEAPVSALLHSIAQFPTYNEGYLKALEALELA